MTRIRILFLCTGNSARSLLAEAIAGTHPSLDAVSAGSRPRGTPQPLALETLAGHGLPTADLRSESWDVYRDRAFDLVITLCDAAAAETCPTFPGGPVHVHWGFPDPPAADDPAALFETVYEALDEAIGRFASDPDSDPPARARRVARWVAERFPGEARPIP